MCDGRKEREEIPVWPLFDLDILAGFVYVRGFYLVLCGTADSKSSECGCKGKGGI